MHPSTISIWLLVTFLESFRLELFSKYWSHFYSCSSILKNIHIIFLGTVWAAIPHIRLFKNHLMPSIQRRALMRRRIHHLLQIPPRPLCKLRQRGRHCNLSPISLAQTIHPWSPLMLHIPSFQSLARRENRPHQKLLLMLPPYMNRQTSTSRLDLLVWNCQMLWLR